MFLCLLSPWERVRGSLLYLERQLTGLDDVLTQVIEARSVGCVRADLWDSSPGLGPGLS